MADLDIAGLVAQLKGRDVLVVEAHNGKAQSHTLTSAPIKLKPGKRWSFGAQQSWWRHQLDPTQIMLKAQLLSPAGAAYLLVSGEADERKSFSWLGSESDEVGEGSCWWLSSRLTPAHRRRAAPHGH